jgi:hypothetical protein
MKQSFIKNLWNLYTYNVISNFLPVWLFQNYQKSMKFFLQRGFRENIDFGIFTVLKKNLGWELFERVRVRAGRVSGP